MKLKLEARPYSMNYIKRLLNLVHSSVTCMILRWVNNTTTCWSRLRLSLKTSIQYSNSIFKTVLVINRIDTTIVNWLNIMYLISLLSCLKLAICWSLLELLIRTVCLSYCRSILISLIVSTLITANGRLLLELSANSRYTSKARIWSLRIYASIYFKSAALWC